MESWLVMSIQLASNRYDGMDEWPPAPGRVFQALVAGSARGDLPDHVAQSLEWLETLHSPIIGAPNVHLGQKFRVFVPNNDWDAVSGTLAKLSDTKVAKKMSPKWLTSPLPLLYGWKFDASDQTLPFARRLLDMAESLYQLGRGTDMAWAQAELLDAPTWADRLYHYRGQIFRPTPGDASALVLSCPTPGTLQSLLDRHEKMGQRFVPFGEGRAKSATGFVQPPKAHFRQVPYNGRATSALFDIKSIDNQESWFVWPASNVAQLVVTARDNALENLRSAVPWLAKGAETVLVGRRSGSTDGAPPEKRVQIIPLPSVGHRYADHGVRRILVVVPAGTGIDPRDILWAFSGLTLSDRETGEVVGCMLCPTDDTQMLKNYGIPQRQDYAPRESLGWRRWQTVTPIALPIGTVRKNPAEGKPAKGTRERLTEEQIAAEAIIQAFRHAGVRSRILDVRVQREPFDSKGDRAEDSATPRFFPARLWHADVELDSPTAGPLVIGDGRFMGLGLMIPKPARSTDEVEKHLLDASEPEPELSEELTEDGNEMDEEEAENDDMADDS